MDKTHGILKISTSVFALFVPSILLAGYSFYLGYNLTFGLSPELLVKSLPDMLLESWYIGVIAMSWLLSKWHYWLALLSIFFCIMVGAFICFLYFKNKGYINGSKTITREHQGKEVLGITQWHLKCFWELFEDLSSWYVIPALVLCGAALLTAFPYSHGQEQANKQIEEHQKYDCEAKEKLIEVANCSYLIDTSVQPAKLIAQGILVTSNGQRIALFNDNKLEVWPLLDHYMISKKHLSTKTTNEKDK